MSMKYMASADKGQGEIVPSVRVAKITNPNHPDYVAPEPTLEPVPEPVEQGTEEVEVEVVAEPKAPTTPKPVTKPAQKKEMVLPPGVLRWGDHSVGGNKGARIQQCIIYQVHLAKNSFWTRVINGGRAYLSQPEVIAKLIGDTPEDFFWDEEDVIGWKRQLDGEYVVVTKFVRRKPKNEEERVRVRDTFGVTPYTRKLLAKDDCKLCHGKGSYKVRPYDDNPHLTAHVECKCSWE